MDPLYAIKLINTGKQVAAPLDTVEEGTLYNNCIGIQKCGGRYRVSITRIAYSDMAGEYFEVDEVVEFQDLNKAFEYINEQSPVPLEALDICKGQKAFDPMYLYSEGRLREYTDSVKDQNAF